MGRCLARRSAERPERATRWEQAAQSSCISNLRDAISTFITSSTDASFTMASSCFWTRSASCSTPKERAAARVSRARSTAAPQRVCQQPLAPQPGSGPLLGAATEAWPL
uniref:Uncharacterized protein n=1 Tax=Zea mays TaxID=4577 RepID=C4J1H6_MAIZE|nr:unknown [Zea mays]|eukprot:NP_001182888.1 uncharacterized protein LOC100501164 [Zea mays]